MSDKPTISVGVNIHTGSATEQPSSNQQNRSNAPETQADSAFCIAVMGDFSGSSNSFDSTQNASRRKLIEIDRDDFEEVMAGFNIQLNLDLSDSESINIKLNELDDFHPDELYENIESFSKLRSLRRRLKNNSSFNEAAAEIQDWLTDKNISDAPAPNTQADTQAETKNNTETDAPTENLLDSILGSPSSSQQPSEANQIDRLIKSIVAPYVESATDPRQTEMLAAVDQATQTHMQDILHHKDFQAMEATWQSLYFLVKRLQTGTKLKIFILDIDKQALQQELAADDLSSTSIYQLFCDPSEGDLPWSVLLGNYSFTDSIEDVLSLANIGSIAQQANAGFIAAADETLAGCKAFAETPDYTDWNYSISEGTAKAWEMLRQSPVASHIALALPRFLLRLPYGKKSKPIDAFEFEEMSEENNHNDYLWGNAAFIKTENLARNFTENSWAMQTSEVFQTDNLPVHYYKEEGETVSKPIAEIMLTEKGGEILNNNGLIALWSVRNMDCIRSSDYRSISKKKNTLKGRWSR